MKTLIIWLIAATALAQDFTVPQSCRELNWGKPGSCVHAVVVTDLNYLGLTDAARQWRKTHQGGEDNKALKKDCNKASVHVCQIFEPSNIRFLESACEEKLGCGVSISQQGGWHCIFLTHFDRYQVIYIDPNYPKEDRKMPTKDFLDIWSGWAFVIYGLK
jgi:hypothetical protein